MSRGAGPSCRRPIEEQPQTSQNPAVERQDVPDALGENLVQRGVSFDFVRVNERERHFGGLPLDVGRDVRCADRCIKVVDQVLARNAGEALPFEIDEQPMGVPGIVNSGPDFLDEAAEEPFQLRIASENRRSPRRVFPAGQAFVVERPGASPGGPPGAARLAREGVAFVEEVYVVGGIGAADAQDAFVLLVAVEQLVAIAEEGEVGKAVVLENDDPLLRLEDLVQGRRDAGVAPHVAVGVDPVDVALPVDGFDDPARGGDSFGLAFAVGSRGVGAEVERFRLRLADLRPDLFGRLGTAEDEKGDGSPHSHPNRPPLSFISARTARCGNSCATSCRDMNPAILRAQRNAGCPCARAQR